MRETAPVNFGKSHTLVLGPFLMPRSQSIEDSLFHLAVLGMDHDDVRYPNICRAPSGPGSLPSLPSPWTDITFGWRIIDFHSARKTNYGYSLLTNKYEQEVSILCWNIPHDYVSTDK